MICLLFETSLSSGWTKAQVISEAVAAIGIVFTLFYSLWSFSRTLRDSSYAELDRMYFELLKIAIERPYLMDTAAATDPTKQREYEVYAFMIWNFLETVYDRCQGWSKKHLRTTWYPIIAAENTLHRMWFDKNRPKFKKPFCDFIEKEYPQE
jgi:hypothetical protein